MVTYTKLRNGQWGLRGHNLTPGATVEVTKRSGETKTEVVGKVFWTGEDGMSVASMRRSNHTSSGAWRSRRNAVNARNGNGRWEGGYRTYDSGTVREDFRSDT